MAKRRGGRQQLGMLERLELFRKRVIELSKLRFVQSGAQANYRISWDAESGHLSSESREPDEEDLRSFLMLFRQFISPSEPVFINRVFTDCLRFVDDESLRTEIRKAREAWRAEMRAGSMGMRVDETNITPKYALDLWINGYYFHNDREKASELERLLEHPLPLARMRFIGCFPKLIYILSFMGGVVDHGLENGLFMDSSPLT